jgi:hypothetical protein
MSDKHSSIVDAATRAARLRQENAEPTAVKAEQWVESEQEEDTPAFSMISADRQRKVMVEFRMLDGNRKARTYSFLVGIDFNPSDGIGMDFSADKETISGRNLAPLFDGLVAQRVAVVREMDDLHADVNLPEAATVVTRIEVKPVE